MQNQDAKDHQQAKREQPSQHQILNIELFHRCANR